MKVAIATQPQKDGHPDRMPAKPRIPRIPGCLVIPAWLRHGPKVQVSKIHLQEARSRRLSSSQKAPSPGTRSRVLRRFAKRKPLGDSGPKTAPDRLLRSRANSHRAVNIAALDPDRPAAGPCPLPVAGAACDGSELDRQGNWHGPAQTCTATLCHGRRPHRRSRAACQRG